MIRAWTCKKDVNIKLILFNYFSEEGDGGSMQQKVLVAFVPMLFVLLMLAYCLCIHKRHQDG